MVRDDLGLKTCQLRMDDPTDPLGPDATDASSVSGLIAGVAISGSGMAPEADPLVSLDGVLIVEVDD